MRTSIFGVFSTFVVAGAVVLATTSSAFGQAEPAGPGSGPGMMSGGYGQGWGPGMPGRGIRPGGMLGGSWQRSPATGDADLALDEVLQFQFNYYASVKEQSTGQGAFELLAEPRTGVVFPEFGPTMMWNTKYGHMGWWWGQQPGDPSVNADQARQIAQQWLDGSQPGSTAETPDIFPGYYTFHTLKDGQISGMLSVNAYTGQVWFHSWHGAFVASSEP